MTIADFSAITSVTGMSLLVPIDEAAHPKLASWIKKMEALPYYQKVNEVGIKDLLHFINALCNVNIKN